LSGVLVRGIAVNDDLVFAGPEILVPIVDLPSYSGVSNKDVGNLLELLTDFERTPSFLGAEVRPLEDETLEIEVTSRRSNFHLLGCLDALASLGTVGN
jgi:hypothetical protein